MSKTQRKAWRKIIVICFRYGSGEITAKEFNALLRPRLKAYQARWHSDLVIA